MTMPAILVALLLAGPGSSALAPAPTNSGSSSPTAPKVETRGVPKARFIPQVNVSAATSGKAKLKIAPEVLFPVGRDSRWDMSVAGQFEYGIKDGAGALTFTGEDANQVKFGFVVSGFMGAKWTRQNIDDWLKKTDEIMDEAVSTCRAVVSCDDPVTTDDKSFCKLLKDSPAIRADEMGRSDLCTAGKARFDALVKNHAELPSTYASRYPVLSISAGAMFNQDVFTHREFDDMGTLSDASTPARWSSDIGLSVAWLPARTVHPAGRSAGYLPSLELHGIYRDKWSAAKDKVEWCETSGMIDGNDVEQCHSATLGAPQRSRQIWGTFLIGVAPRFDDDWRVAGGPIFSAKLSGDGPDYSAGGHLPFYFNFANLSLQKGEYKGVLRVAPTIYFTQGTGEVTVLATFAVLGARNLFGGPFEWL